MPQSHDKKSQPEGGAHEKKRHPEGGAHHAVISDKGKPSTERRGVRSTPSFLDKRDQPSEQGGSVYHAVDDPEGGVHHDCGTLWQIQFSGAAGPQHLAQLRQRGGEK